MRIGVIKVDRGWVFWKVLLTGISLLYLWSGIPLVALGLGLIIFQGATHEFIHAGAAKFLGGNVTGIFLYQKGPYIDFEVKTERDYRAVYGAGAIYEILLIMTAACCFIATGNTIIIALSYLTVIALLCYCVCPEESDYNQWLRREEKP